MSINIQKFIMNCLYFNSEMIKCILLASSRFLFYSIDIKHTLVFLWIFQSNGMIYQVIDSQFLIFKNTRNILSTSYSRMSQLSRTSWYYELFNCEF
ncbi:MAG: hypothetical protein C4524_02450 [Candidatus Zixiibacteriota bacterium]|nr:MAG: hypothetical protein C4524_02450 [candidate division Zixibacteria bacterium]